jgi:uncharacterized protein YcbX
MMAGRVSEMWRYPVKSMGGEVLGAAHVGALGIPGDRGWALRDEAIGEIRGAKKIAPLLTCRARYLEEPSGERISHVAMTLPGASGELRSDDPEAGARLSEAVGRSVTLWPRQPSNDHEHYRRRAPDDPDFEQELRTIFGRTPDEPLPDLSAFPPELFEFVSPLGTYFDAAPLHLLSTASLRALAALAPGARFDVRRFRPNFLIDTGAEQGFVERDWCGGTFRLGSAVIRVEMPTVRCVMTTLPQFDLPKDPTVLRTVVRDAGQNLGVYASVVTPGEVRGGDTLERLAGG